MLPKSLLEHFQTNFPDAPPLLVRAPGRINLIGEHTDYNLGWVMPGSIDKCLWLALGVNSDPENCRAIALDLNETARFPIGETAADDHSWTAYLKAIVLELQERDYPVRGFCGVFGGDIPVGAGLSSSAALCCGLVSGLAELFQFKIERREIALIAQAAEHRIGLNCGLMDQYAVLFGKKEQLLLLDCKTLDFQYVPLQTGDYALVLLNSGVKHALAAGSGYNERRLSCEKVVAQINLQYPEVQSLRDVDRRMLAAARAALNPTDYRRAAYVLAENERVLRTVEALRAQDLVALGQLLYQAHEGLRTEYEVTVPELDLLVDLARQEPGILGARMVGGGFGGCTLNLVKTSEKASILERIADHYFKKTGILPERIEVRVDDGVLKLM